MSVRRSAVSADSMGGAGLMKSALFWVGMLTASFLLGFLVFAPLMNLAYARRGDANPAPAGANASGPKPSGTTHAAAPPTRKRNVPPDEEVGITPERSSEGTAIQNGEEPTRTSAERDAEGDGRTEGSPTTDERTSGRSDRADGDLTVESGDRPRRNTEPTATEHRSTRGARERGDNAENTERSGRTGRGDRSEQTGASPDAPRGEETPSEPRGRRSRRTRGADDTPARRSTRSGDDGDIQRGEGIDR